MDDIENLVHILKFCTFSIDLPKILHTGETELPMLADSSTNSKNTTTKFFKKKRETN